MKRLLLLVLVVVAVLVYVYRQRLYLRDAIATVTVDGVTDGGMRVYINASNDVLLETGGLIGTRTLVQHGNKAPGVPTGTVTCEWRVLCLLEADKVPLSPVDGGPADAHVNMTSKLVTFTDESKGQVQVRLY